MPQQTIPLILPATARGWAASVGTSAKDQQLINGFYQVSDNTQASSKTVYLQKRPGSTTGAVTLGTSVRQFSIFADIDFAVALYFVPAGGSIYNICDDIATVLGTTVGAPYGPVTNYIATDAIIGGVSVVAWTAGAAGSAIGHFLFGDAVSTNFPTFTGNRTSGSAVISGIASTTGIYKGQAISGTGIPGSTRVLSVDSATQITMDQNASSGAGTATTITKEAVAKITDAQFPTKANSLVFMDGYLFAGTSDGNIQHSAINQPWNWAASDTIAADWSGDGMACIGKTGNNIVAYGLVGSVQYFYNAGNSSGSVLSEAPNLNVSGLSVQSTPYPLGGAQYCLARKSGIAISNYSGAPSGSMGLYKIVGTNTYQKVSDSSVDEIIRSYITPVLGSVEIGGKTMLAIFPGNSSTFLVYDEFTSQFQVMTTSAAITSAFGSRLTRGTSSTIFEWSSGNTWTDSSVAYTLTAQTQPYTLNGGSPFIIPWVDLVADTESTGTATLYVSRDDYASWENVGTFDMTAQRKRIHALGWFHSNVAFKIEHSADTNFRAQSLLVNFARCNG